MIGKINLLCIRDIITLMGNRIRIGRLRRFRTVCLFLNEKLEHFLEHYAKLTFPSPVFSGFDSVFDGT